MKHKNTDRLIPWLNSNRSDLYLYLIIILLANIAAGSWFFRLDLSRSDVYSLSETSHRLFASIEEPLNVNVFFSSDLPAPYNGVERYTRDLLEEYRRSAGPDFSLRFHDMEKEESKAAAADYGIRPLQIQEIQSDQFQSRNAYMGIALVYGDEIETVDQINSQAGLEYRISTTVQKMISSVNALHGLTGTPKLELYASSSLKEFNIQGFDTLETRIDQAAQRLSESIGQKIEFQRIDPAREELEELQKRNGIQLISWKDHVDSTGREIPAGTGALDLLLRYGDRSKLIPIDIGQQLFGAYQISGMDRLEERIDEAIDALLSNNPVIAYLDAFGTKSLSDPRNGAAGLRPLLSDMYEIQELKPEEDKSFSIPGDVSTLIINGARQKLPEEVLYQVDQFLLGGGSLVIFADPFAQENPPQGSYMQAPRFTPLETGLEDQISQYGLKLKRAYVMDSESYVQRDPQYGEMQLYWAPLISREGFQDDSVVSAELGELLALQSGSIEIDQNLQEADSCQWLLRSSERSWLMEKNIQLNPMAIRPPEKEMMKSSILAASIEGHFTSAFSEPPGNLQKEENHVQRLNHLSESSSPGRLVLAASSLYTTAQLLQPDSINGNSAFVHNIVDWAAGNSEVIPMRTKGLSRNRLIDTTAATRQMIKGSSIAGIPLLVLLAGLLVWRTQRHRRRAIQERFSGGSSNE